MVRKLIVVSVFIFWALVTSIMAAGFMSYQNNLNGPKLPTGKFVMAGFQGSSDSAGDSPTDTVISGGTVLSLEEVAKHGTERDCWIVINNKIYDITNYIPYHPSGPSTITPYCGKDATTAFATKDTGSSHSSYAENMLVNYYVGDLGSKINSATTSTANQPTNQATPQPTNNTPSQTSTPPASQIPDTTAVTNNNNSPSNNITPSTNTTTNNIFSLQEIAVHNSQNNCWIIVNGNVYDVTNYIPYHPGGPSTIVPYCGEDATAAFASHSSYADSLLSNYYKGIVGTASTATTGGTNDNNISSNTSSNITSTTNTTVDNNTTNAANNTTENNIIIVNTTDVTTTTGASTGSFSLQEISVHNTQNNCWIILGDKVYDITSYIPYHPGGASAIVKYCGKDASDAFAGHSSYADSLLASYYKGTVAVPGSDTNNTVPIFPTADAFKFNLTWDGYDYDNAGETALLINGQTVATLPSAGTSANNDIYNTYRVDLSKYIASDANTITFKQNIYSSGVRNVQVSGPAGIVYSNITSYSLSDTGLTVINYNFNVQAGITNTTSPATNSINTSQSGSVAYAADIVNGQMADSSGNKFSLIGINYGDHPGSFRSGNFATDAQNIKNAGFNTVKLVKEWGALENSASPSVFTYDNNEMQKMMQQIDALTKNGINVVIKIHADSDTSSNAQHLNNFLGSQYCAPSGSYESDFSTNFYTTSYSADGTTGVAHLTKLILKISQMTRNNSRVIGFDPMNEPTYCSYTSSSVSQTIRTGWHQRVKELVQVLRDDGDNRIIFAEEAPMFEYYSNFVSWNDPKIVSSIHWYRAEYKTSSGTWAACWGDLQTLQGYWGNTGRSGSSCSSVPLQIAQAQQKYPNQLFEVGEFGNIYGNTAGDLSDQWILNSVALFKLQKAVGWFYWSSSGSGTWVSDITR